MPKMNWRILAGLMLFSIPAIAQNLPPGALGIPPLPPAPVSWLDQWKACRQHWHPGGPGEPARPALFDKKGTLVVPENKGTPPIKPFYHPGWEYCEAVPDWSRSYDAQVEKEQRDRAR